MKFKTTNESIGARLDKFLTEKLTDLSRSQIQKLIKAGAAAVNGNIVSAHYTLKNNDLIIFSKKEKTNKLAEEKKETTAPIAWSEIKIIAKTPDYLIINKPAGIAVHGAAHMKEKTLVDFLLEKFPEIKKIGDDPGRPGIVHRLDKEASGLLAIARTQKFFDNLKKQFQERRVGKKYTALVYDEVKKIEGLINFPIERASDGHKMAALPLTFKGIETQKGRRAITEFQIIKKFINYTLLKIKIKTGRTHQIRVHLSAYGHPLVGDKIYGTGRTRLCNKKIKLGRIFLVADELSFIDLDEKKQYFKIDLPEKLKIFLKKIK